MASIAMMTMVITYHFLNPLYFPDKWIVAHHTYLLICRNYLTTIHFSEPKPLFTSLTVHFVPEFYV